MPHTRTTRLSINNKNNNDCNDVHDDHDECTDDDDDNDVKMYTCVYEYVFTRAKFNLLATKW